MSQHGYCEGDPRMTVELAVTPYFCKAEKADGDAYDSERIISKSVVVGKEAWKQTQEKSI